MPDDPTENQPLTDADIQEIPEAVHEAAAELARRLLKQPPQDG